MSTRTISEHIINIYGDHELSPEATIRKFRLVQTEGSRQVERLMDFYNLDMILAIGYRVRSHRGVQFRRWATERLKEYIIKGFVLDDERLKGERVLGTDYFDELLERIRDIRASEKRFYQKVRDIYALSPDYDSQAEGTQEFFKIVQNKLHWAITGQTGARSWTRSCSSTSEPYLNTADASPLKKRDVWPWSSTRSSTGGKSKADDLEAEKEFEQEVGKLMLPDKKEKE